MSFNYRSITAAVIAAADKKPGHSDVVLFSPTSAFTTIAMPTSPATGMGDTKRITDNHTFPTNGGWKTIQCKAKSIDGTADAAGEAGGQVITYKYKLIVKGDSAEINEFIGYISNEDIIALFNDPVCGQNNYVQLGSACTPANISGLTFRSGSKGAGGFKEYEFVVESSDKFFYEGDVTMAVEGTQLAAIPYLVATAVADTTATISKGAAVANAETYTLEHSTSSSFTSPVAITGDADGIFNITGLTASTTYYVRMKAVATGYVDSAWEIMSFTTTA